IAHTVEGAKRQNGHTGKAIIGGFMLLLQIIGTGSVGCFIIGAAAVLANNLLPSIATVSTSLAAAQATIPAAGPGSMPLLAGSVVMGGILCALFQALASYTALPVPKILILGMMVGGLLTSPGVMSSLSILGGAGADIMVVGAGSAVTATTMALLAGIPVPLVTVMCVFIALAVLGCIWGLIRARTPER
ncbi:MAG: hypothetical protein LBK67_10410, partial [Coriobacteriales bacterium]|nr:hypothetical protein [Coriobacteriales bacterium]